jgi:hypothetical protein
MVSMLRKKKAYTDILFSMLREKKTYTEIPFASCGRKKHILKFLSQVAGEKSIY